MEFIAELNGKSQRVRYRRGSVIDVQKWSETSISGYSTGGGGYLHQGTGHISAPSLHIRSSTEVRSNVFVRWDDGTESAMTMGEEPALRVGSNIDSMHLPDAPRENNVLFIRNLDTQSQWLAERIIPPEKPSIGRLARRAFGTLLTASVIYGFGAVMHAVFTAQIEKSRASAARWAARYGTSPDFSAGLGETGQKAGSAIEIAALLFVAWIAWAGLKWLRVYRQRRQECASFWRNARVAFAGEVNLLPSLAS